MSDKQDSAFYPQDKRQEAMNGLIEFIFANTSHQVSSRLVSWLKNNSRFEDFTARNRDKIHKKVKGAKTNEDLEDVLAELFVAYLLILDRRITVQYERLGSGNSGPDLSASFEQSLQFNVEVARIRRVETDLRFYNWHKEIVSGIKAGPSNLEFRLHPVALEFSPLHMERLEQSKESITRFVNNTIQREEASLPFEAQRDYPIPGFEDVLILVLSKHSSGEELNGPAFNILIPIAYTQKEHLKFGNIIVDKLGQLPLGELNIIFVRSDSNTHEPEDLSYGIDSFLNALSRGEENVIQKVKRNFRDIEDFHSQFRKLSVIVFRSNWEGHESYETRNLLWCNPQADCQIPEDIREYLEKVDVPSA